MVLRRFFVLLCAVARRARAAVAFVTPANTANAAPAAVALLRVRRFVPPSSGFFVVARPSTITSLRASHLRRFFDGDGPLDTLAVDVTRTEMLVALARLRSSAQMKSFLRGAPWPLEMFFWAVAPQKLADRGFEHTVALDADVFAMDGQIIDVLPTVRGIGIVRIFPKECYTAAMPASKARLPAFVPPLVDAVKIAAAPHAFAHRDGTNSGVIVFNNSRMVEVDLLRWCLDAVVAANGAVYGDQDLLNLIIGRRDIDVRYLHPRFNVQLAYPARQKDAFMDPPWCGYGQAQFVAAAAGGALNSSSFGHFIWTRKPWTAQVDGELRRIYGDLARGGRTGMQYMVLASPPWVNAWRDFAVDALGPDTYSDLFKLDPARRVVDFTLLLASGHARSPRRCIGADVSSCGAVRPEADVPFPSPFAGFSDVQRATRRIPRIADDPTRRTLAYF
jgi:hypothetical protein